MQAIQIVIQTTVGASAREQRAQLEWVAGQLRGELRAALAETDPTVFLVGDSDPLQLRIASVREQQRLRIEAIIETVARQYPRLGLVVPRA